MPALGQFTAAELAARSDWETFLREAEIVDRVQMEREEGVTRPWKLTLRRGEVVRHALWKDASGIRGGFWEGWKYEIAAYLLDKRLGVGMVPPTVEKALDGRPGSCQLWIEGAALYGDMLAARQGLESFRSEGWKKAGYVAQLFDDIVGNEDRHTRNVLVTADFRAILIDHSRTFRTMKSFVEGVPFSDKNVPAGEPPAKAAARRSCRTSGTCPRERFGKPSGICFRKRRSALCSPGGRSCSSRSAKVVERFGEADVLY